MLSVVKSTWNKFHLILSYVVGDLWIGGPMRRGPMRWGTNEMGDQWVGGTNEMGDQWNGWCMGANWGTNQMGHWWVGGPMRWGTNEMGDQWDGGPLGLADDGLTNEKGDQWDGGPVTWGTNEMGDQWAPIMYWGTNELGDQWEGDQWDGGPMRWGTSERIPAVQLYSSSMKNCNECSWSYDWRDMFILCVWDEPGTEEVGVFTQGLILTLAALSW